MSLNLAYRRIFTQSLNSECTPYWKTKEMKRILLTQRVEEVSSYKERRDCLDQEWTTLLEDLNLQPILVPNKLKNIKDWLDAQRPDGIILTGGNDPAHLLDASNPAPERDKTENSIMDYASKHSIHLLGVCRGLQMMNVYFKGALSNVENHVAQRHSVESKTEEGLWKEYDTVNSFHVRGIKEGDLGDNLDVLVKCNDQTIEALKHKQLPWIGIMWHPEREQPFSEIDKTLISKLFKA